MNIRNKGLAVLAGVGVAGLVGAAAASLNLTNDSLGADADVVASCDTDGINVEWTTAYDATAQAYEVSDVVLTGVAAACDGLDVEISVTDGTTVLATESGTAATGTTTVSLLTAIDASLVDGIDVVISG